MQKQKEIFLLQIYITINSHISQLDFIEMIQEFYGTFSTGKKNHSYWKLSYFFDVIALIKNNGKTAWRLILQGSFIKRYSHSSPSF
jgi:hypothetical protein